MKCGGSENIQTRQKAGHGEESLRQMRADRFNTSKKRCTVGGMFRMRVITGMEGANPFFILGLPVLQFPCLDRSYRK